MPDYRITNNAEQDVIAGTYTFTATGALDLQIQIIDEGFNTLPNGSFTGIDSGTIEVSKCTLKVINGSSNEFVMRRNKTA